jgi:putative transcriptional regulator
MNTRKPHKRLNTGTRIDPDLLDGDSPFRNTLLVAMPGMHDSFFSRSVIYICAHSAQGAMGIVINQRLPDMEFSELASQLHLPRPLLSSDPVVHFGGPVETGRGFVLHSTDFIREDTVRVTDGICMTGTIDILSAIAEGKGPDRSIFALGYSGWGAGQLESEIERNSWLTMPADEDLIFSLDLARKWDMAMARMGVNPLMLSVETGHA